MKIYYLNKDGFFVEDVPDSAGATPAPSANTFDCEMCQERFEILGNAWNHEGKLYCLDCYELILVTTPKVAPVIEQKHVCVLCTEQIWGKDKSVDDDDFEPICHEDPCQYTHLERLMLPIAKAQFRARQLEREKAQDVAMAYERDLENLTKREQKLATVEDRTGWKSSHYTRLTGHRFKAE